MGRSMDVLFGMFSQISLGFHWDFCLGFKILWDLFGIYLGFHWDFSLGFKILCRKAGTS
jgi:hypothetical protein